MWRYFNGRWKITKRVITDIHTKDKLLESIGDSNVASFIEWGDDDVKETEGSNKTLLYSEQLQVCLLTDHSTNIRATKQYLYSFPTTGTKDFEMYFYPKPTTLFQRLVLSDDTRRYDGHHQCPPDEYKTTLLIKSPKEFQVIIKTTGPKKQYYSKTLYHKIS